MKKFKILLVCCGVLSLVGCKTVCPPGERIEIHDEVEKVVTVHDTILYTPPASVTEEIALSDLLLKDMFKPVLKTHKHATLSQKIIRDTLVSTCLCDTTAIKAQLMNVVTTRVRSTVSKLVLPPVEVKYIPKVYKWCAWIIGIEIFLLLLYGFFRWIKWMYGFNFKKNIPF